jgi:3-methyl-2-oxobutanoate hydroxymethyltransferase
MKQTISSIQKTKNKQKLTMVTAYDTLFAKLFDEQVDMILVGDSLNMSFFGAKDTLSATLKQMIYHTNAVCNGAKNTFIICDMPFGTYTNKKVALKNCIKVYKKTKADAVKIEGGKDKAHIIKHLVSNSIAVVGHIGLMPQFVRSEGGYKIKGKDEVSITKLIEDAKAVEEAGAFLLVIEGVKPQAAKVITEAVNIPTIGIGAGIHTDGQVLVWSDMFGFFEDFKPKFVREYLKGASLIKEAIKQYDYDVKTMQFPLKGETY